MDLIRLGWCDSFAASFAPYADSGLGAARVGVGHRGGYELYTADGEYFGQVSGRFRHGAAGPGEFPVVGDWVAIEAQPDGRTATIHAVLPRRSKFSRVAPGDRTEEQVLAANMDDVWIVAALAADLNLRRIERYLALAWQSGAEPGLVLTKADLCGDVATAVIQAEASARGVTVWVVSSLTGDGVEVLRDRLRAGRTGVLLGPSGVGKSTLINCLCGNDIQAVQPVRADDQKGRHTTVRREMIAVPSGGWIIDTPGLRELQLWDGEAGIDEAFDDIARLAAECRFGDCRHESEPGCAVLRAVESGTLDLGRLESHRKLQREQAWFERRHDAAAQSRERRRWRSVTKSLREHYRQKNPPDT